MAWIEAVKLRNGVVRFRVVERDARGKRVKGPLLHSRRDAERLAGRTGLEKQRDELSLSKKDYPIERFLAEIPERLHRAVSPGYLKRLGSAIRHFQRFLKERAPGIRTLSEVTKPLLFEYRQFRIEEAEKPREREVTPPAPDATELTVAQSALLLGYSVFPTRVLIHKGHLEARKVPDGRRPAYFLVRRASLDAFMETEEYARGKEVSERTSKRRLRKRSEQPQPTRLRGRTLNLELSMIWTLLNKATEWGLITDHPIASMKGLKLPEHDSRIFRALDDHEFERFRVACPAWLLPPLLTAALLGLREKEVRTLEWADVDFQGRIVKVRNKHSLILKSQALTGIREFRMPMPQVLFEALSQLALDRARFQDDLCFHNSVGQPFPANGLRKLLIEVLRGIGVRDVTQVHALRKTFITHLARRERNVFLVQQLARHKDVRTTQRYVTIFDDEKRRAMMDFDIGAPRRADERRDDDGPGALRRGS